MRSATVRSNLLVPEVREVMDIRQASDYLGISSDTLYNARIITRGYRNEAAHETEVQKKYDLRAQ